MRGGDVCLVGVGGEGGRSRGAGGRRGGGPGDFKIMRSQVFGLVGRIDVLRIWWEGIWLARIHLMAREARERR